MAADAEWIGLRDAAKIIGVSESTVYRSVARPERADKEWGAGNWRRHVRPLGKREILQVRPVRAREIAAAARRQHPVSEDVGARASRECHESVGDALARVEPIT